MRIVSSNTDTEIATERALQRIDWPLRELAANIMRIIRGAGKPEYLVDHLVSVLEAISQYQSVAGGNPSGHDYYKILDLDRCHTEGFLGARGEWDYAIRDMVEGGLQHAASELLGQGTQEAAGRRQIFQGLTVIEGIREKNRREVMAAATARKAITRKPRAKAPIKRK